MQAWARLVEAGVRSRAEPRSGPGIRAWLVWDHMGRRTGTRIIALAIVAVLQVDATAAQWPNQTPGIPRRADGKVDLTAPAPRAADGKPDLSGTWRFSGKNYVDDVKLPLQPVCNENEKYVGRP